MSKLNELYKRLENIPYDEAYEDIQAILDCAKVFISYDRQDLATTLLDEAEHSLELAEEEVEAEQVYQKSSLLADIDEAIACIEKDLMDRDIRKILNLLKYLRSIHEKS